MAGLLDSLFWVGTGMVSWPALEYALHGGLFHNGPKTIQATADHLDHHRDPTQNDTPDWTYLKGLKMMLPIVVEYATYVQIGLTPVLGMRRAALTTGGLILGFLIYEEFHQGIHRRPPRNAYEEKMWKHHLSHHFENPKKNHGVTVDLFDHLFGTYEKPAEVIEIPEHLANRWMKEALPEGYVIKKRRMPKSRQAVA